MERSVVMEIKCDVDKTKALVKDIDLNIARYEEIVKNFYDIVKNFDVHGWVGQSAADYTAYLEKKKIDFDCLSMTLHSFNETAKKNVEELEMTIGTSKVSGNE